jgi:hypothetical protein
MKTEWHAYQAEIVERFLRTLKEQMLWTHHFRNLTEAQQVIGQFIARYNPPRAD